MDSVTGVRKQYERFPYPPIPRFALPASGEGETLRYETGTRLAFGQSRPHRGIHILVAGAGTFEPLVVAQAHPEAAQITALDLSKTSLGILGRRIRIARLTLKLRPWRELPPVAFECADLRVWQPDRPFDLILASNVLHHLPVPATGLERLASWLAPEGLMRIVTYPKASRIWMREVSKHLRNQGISAETPRLVRAAIDCMARLPAEDPRRSCFFSHPERRTREGLVDAFLHACEEPLAPLEWRRAVIASGLRLAGECQTETSRSAFLDDLLPEGGDRLDAWEKLQILDDLLELCANPVLWLARGSAESRGDRCEVAPSGTHSNYKREIAAGLARIKSLLRSAGVEVTLEELHSRLKRGVGPRVSANHPSRILPGLSLSDYGLRDLLALDESK